MDDLVSPKLSLFPCCPESLSWVDNSSNFFMMFYDAVFWFLFIYFFYLILNKCTMTDHSTFSWDSSVSDSMCSFYISWPWVFISILCCAVVESTEIIHFFAFSKRSDILSTHFSLSSILTFSWFCFQLLYCHTIKLCTMWTTIWDLSMLIHHLEILETGSK